MNKGVPSTFVKSSTGSFVLGGNEIRGNTAQGADPYLSQLLSIKGIANHQNQQQQQQHFEEQEIQEMEILQNDLYEELQQLSPPLNASPLDFNSTPQKAQRDTLPEWMATILNSHRETFPVPDCDSFLNVLKSCKLNDFQTPLVNQLLRIADIPRKENLCFTIVGRVVVWSFSDLAYSFVMRSQDEAVVVYLNECLAQNYYYKPKGKLAIKWLPECVVKKLDTADALKQCKNSDPNKSAFTMLSTTHFVGRCMLGEFLVISLNSWLNIETPKAEKSQYVKIDANVAAEIKKKKLALKNKANSDFDCVREILKDKLKNAFKVGEKVKFQVFALIKNEWKDLSHQTEFVCDEISTGRHKIKVTKFNINEARQFYMVLPELEYEHKFVFDVFSNKPETFVNFDDVPQPTWPDYSSSSCESPPSSSSDDESRSNKKQKFGEPFELSEEELEEFLSTVNSDSAFEPRLTFTPPINTNINTTMITNSTSTTEATTSSNNNKRKRQDSR